MGIIYIIQLREFIGTDKYKIGRSDTGHLIRVNQYPKGSILLFLLTCNDSRKIEKKIIDDFKIKYKHLIEYGNEYFEGFYKKMIYDIIDISKESDTESDTESEADSSHWILHHDKTCESRTHYFKSCDNTGDFLCETYNGFIKIFIIIIYTKIITIIIFMFIF